MNIYQFQYAAKFICGKEEGKILAPGQYWTAVNVHNPSPKPIRFRKKISVALPGERAGKVTQDFWAKLGPYESLEIDCPDIMRHLGIEVPFVKGFVVLTSDEELEVVAVYTAAGREGAVTSIDVEEVPYRRVKLSLPELVPVKDPKHGYCERDDRGNLIVTIANQGAIPSGPCSTEVDFFSFGKIVRPTPSIPAGGTTKLAFPIPKSCFNPDCEFRITVDIYKQVMEYSEGNNIVDVTCIG